MFFFSVGCHLRTSSLLDLPECLRPLPRPLILPDGMDPLFVPIFWIKAGEEVEETSLPCSSGSLSVGREGSGGKNVYTYDYTRLHVFQRSHCPGKVTVGVFSVVCFLGNYVTFTDDQWLLCFSKNYARKMVQRVLDRMLTGYHVCLSLHMGGKPRLDIWGFFLKYSWFTILC